MADEQTHPAPGAFGVDHLTRLVEDLRRHLDTLLVQQHRETQALLGTMHREAHAGQRRIEKSLASIERLERIMGNQLSEMDAKLENIANQETVLGQSIQQVVDALKAIPNPPQDLTAQLGKLDQIAQVLVDTNASTLANLPPTPPPPPQARRK